MLCSFDYPNPVSVWLFLVGWVVKTIKIYLQKEYTLLWYHFRVHVYQILNFHQNFLPLAEPQTPPAAIMQDISVDPLQVQDIDKVS